jgi:hypothetical protein
MRLAAPLTVAVMLLVGCGAPSPKLCVDQAFTAEQFGDIASAAQEWNDRAGLGITVVQQDGGDGCSDVRKADYQANGGLGHTHMATGTIYLSTRGPLAGALEGYDASEFPLRLTALHELGHLLTGPTHSTDPGDVMYPLPEGQTHLTDADVARLDR